jgi:hypothetical protein
MTRHTRSLGLLRPCLPAVLVVCLLPASSSAQTLLFRNECPAPVVVQAVSIFRGRVFRDRPYMLNSGDTTPGIALPGDKLVTIYDAKVPNRVIFQGAIPAGPGPLLFGVVPDVVPGRVRIDPRRLPPR